VEKMDTVGLIFQAEALATAKLRESKMMPAPSTYLGKCFKGHCGENTTWRDRGRERESLMGVAGKGGCTAELNP
jgi:hypothetical protein